MRWYHGITKYQWLVLLIASLGWVFDVFEGQVFVASMDELAAELLGNVSQQTKSLYNNFFNATFLLGGAVGGVAFGIVSDRIGRARTMILTILMYSVCTCLTAFAQTWWQVAVLRFLVATGVGGEWAVASSMVAEHFPARARPWSGAIFHASSVLGTLLATLVGLVIVANPQFGWRWAFGIGVLPALLTLWIRWQLQDGNSASLQQRQERVVSLAELFGSENFRHLLTGVALATVGLATFWGVHIYGKNTLKECKIRSLQHAGVDENSESARGIVKRAEMTGMFLTTIGGGAGLLAFGPVCAWLGRRPAFALFHLGGCIAGLTLFSGLRESPLWITAMFLPIFGFLTLGMHAGYAIYFPELFPTGLRGAGTGVCFNAGRILAAPVLLGSGWVQERFGISIQQSASRLSLLYLLGLIVLLFATETKGKELR